MTHSLLSKQVRKITALPNNRLALNTLRRAAAGSLVFSNSGKHHAEPLWLFCAIYKYHDLLTYLLKLVTCEQGRMIGFYAYGVKGPHPSIHSRRPSVPCGCCTCLEFIATQCSVYVVAGILLSTSKDSSVRCIISSLTLNAILELNFVQCACNSFCDSVT